MSRLALQVKKVLLPGSGLPILSAVKHRRAVHKYIPKSGVWIFSFSKSSMVAVEGRRVWQFEGVISSAILNVFH